MAKVIFFDINGTLIQRDSRTDLPFGQAVDLLLKQKNSLEGVNTAARSDEDVFREILSKRNITFSTTLWADFLDLYEKELNTFKASDIWRANVDCLSYLDGLKKTDYHLGLITGELSIGAQYKLEKLGIWNLFETGGFGEDGLTRFQIAEAAMKKMAAHLGEALESVWIIGDTLLDIKTARHIGAGVITITTGANTREELEALFPDQIIDQFSEIEKL